jgi:hypothetical protein|tara:strand:- start:43 stop:411 length:369 start_codon:yes stop_codon:yes gene_type:complete
MSKILQTQLPIAVGPVNSELFNRLVRVLEINLASVDVDNTRQVNDTDKETQNFIAGSIIWNTTLGVLQVYTGFKWVDIGERLNNFGFETQATLGQITVTTNGNVSIDITSSYEGYGVEKWYS